MTPGTQMVLGGEGLIGRGLAQRLREAGEPVESFDLRSGFDLRARDLPEPAPNAFVWFLAWDSGGAHYIYDPARQEEIERSNVALSERVFGWLERTETPFLFCTSQLAGAPHAYGRTKAMGEARTRRLGGRIARLWNVYGAEEPGVRRHFIPDLIARAESTGEVRLATRGRERRQLIHVLDCVAGLVEQRDRGIMEADLTSGKWVEVSEVASRLALRLGVPFIPGDREGYEFLHEPTRRLPGWTPTVDLDEGLALVVNEMRRRGWCDSSEG